MTEANVQPAPVPKVLVVDDEDLIRDSIVDLLVTYGIDVVAASGADQCMERLRGGFRGVILMDVMMPGKSGWDAVREMEAAGLLRGNVVSMLTAMDAPDERMEGLQEVIIDYIRKPFNPTELLESVKKYFSYVETGSTSEA